MVGFFPRDRCGYDAGMQGFQMRHVGMVLIALCIAMTARAAGADEVSLNDAENPRNVRFTGMIIEYLEVTPKKHVEEIGDVPGGPESREAKLIVHLRNLTDAPANALVEGAGFRAQSEMITPGETGRVEWVLPADSIPFAAVFTAKPVGPDGVEGEVTDKATLISEATMRVALLVDRATFEAGNERFGSFTRRMRKSFDDLHTLFDDVSATTTGGVLKRQAISDRFRIDHVELYDQESDPRPELFDEHPQFDLVIACNERGPLCCFWLPAYSIGHNFWNEANGFGLWSSWGEQALWHEMLHFRGVQDFYLYRVAKEALPGRASRDVELPMVYRDSLMNSPYQTPRISALAAHIANFKGGIARVGVAEEPDQPYGHMWQWLPARLQVHVDLGGRPLARATARWWRSLPAEYGGRRQHGVQADRAPDGSAMLNRLGEVSIRGDYLGAKLPRDERSLWLLFEVEYEGERRFAIISGLWLNEMYASEREIIATCWLDWESMEVMAPKATSAEEMESDR